jgi:hypothetical protein
VLNELSEMFDKVPTVVEKVENPSLITPDDILAALILLTHNSDIKVLYALSDEIVAEEMKAVSTVRAVIS